VLPLEKLRTKYETDEDIDWLFATSPEMHRGPEQDFDAFVKKAKWLRYYPVNVFYPKEASRVISALQEIADSPIVPTELRQLLEELLGAIAKNESEVLNAIAQVSQDLPNAYPTRALLADANLSYWHNRVNDVTHDQSDWTGNLRNYLRRYFEPDRGYRDGDLWNALS
jgi:hypothetical protein